MQKVEQGTQRIETLEEVPLADLPERIVLVKVSESSLEPIPIDKTVFGKPLRPIEVGESIVVDTQDESGKNLHTSAIKAIFRISGFLYVKTASKSMYRIDAQQSSGPVDQVNFDSKNLIKIIVTVFGKDGPPKTLE